jgi:hypothetical protein
VPSTRGRGAIAFGTITSTVGDARVVQLVATYFF